MTQPAIVKTDDGLVTLLPADADTTAIEATFAEGYLELDKMRCEFAEWQDDVRRMFRTLLSTRGRKKVVVSTPRGEVAVRLVPRYTMRCQCHVSDPLLCPDAIAGNIVRLTRVEVDPSVSIKRIDGSETEVA